MDSGSCAFPAHLSGAARGLGSVHGQRLSVLARGGSVLADPLRPARYGCPRYGGRQPRDRPDTLIQKQLPTCGESTNRPHAAEVDLGTSMKHERQAILAMVAAGRISPAQAER